MLIVANKHIILRGEGKTTCMFSVSMNAFPLNFRFACYQQARSVWSGGNRMEIRWALAENVYVVLPHPLFWVPLC